MPDFFKISPTFGLGLSPVEEGEEEGAVDAMVGKEKKVLFQ
jgi:hypothetical protein